MEYEMERIWFTAERWPFFLIASLSVLLITLFLVGPKDQLYLVAFAVFLIFFGSLVNLVKEIWRIWKKTK